MGTRTMSPNHVRDGDTHHVSKPRESNLFWSRMRFSVSRRSTATEKHIRCQKPLDSACLWHRCVSPAWRLPSLFELSSRPMRSGVWFALLLSVAACGGDDDGGGVDAS